MYLPCLTYWVVECGSVLLLVNISDIIAYVDCTGLWLVFACVIANVFQRSLEWRSSDRDSSEIGHKYVCLELSKCCLGRLFCHWLKRHACNLWLLRIFMLKNITSYYRHLELADKSLKLTIARWVGVYHRCYRADRRRYILVCYPSHDHSEAHSKTTADVMMDNGNWIKNSSWFESHRTWESPGMHTGHPPFRVCGRSSDH
jgi:hypothetical protein